MVSSRDYEKSAAESLRASRFLDQTAAAGIGLPAQAHTMATPSAGRLVYLDWLRFFVVLCLAPFHASLSFTGVGVAYVYDAPLRDLILATGHAPGAAGPLAMRLFTTFLENCFMHLLFFISGIGACHSLRKRRPSQFVAERANHLMLPLLIGTLAVISIQSWLRAFSFGRFSGGFFAFYPHFFNGIHGGPGSRGKGRSR